MPNLVPYCIYNSLFDRLTINTRDTSQPINTNLWNDSTVQCTYDNVVDYVVEMLQRASDEEHSCDKLLIKAEGDGDAQWFTQMCARLNDRSVYVEYLLLSCDSQLPLHLFIAKLGACDVLDLSLSSKLEMVPNSVTNQSMLEQLALSVTSPCSDTSHWTCMTRWRFGSSKQHAHCWLTHRSSPTICAMSNRWHTLINNHWLSSWLPKCVVCASKPSLQS